MPTPETQQQVTTVLEEDAQIVSDEHLEELLVGQPQPIAARSSG